MGKRVDKSTFVTEYMDGDSTSIIGSRHGVSDETVRVHLHSQGVVLRKRTPVKVFDRTYFHEMDTWEKFYILGFFAADGSVHVTDRSRGLCFTCKDEDVLNFIVTELKHENPTIHIRNNGVRSLILSDSEMTKMVESYGFVHRKAKVLEYPSFIKRHKFEDAFITGLFDGDGSLVKYSSGFWSLRFYGTESVVGGVYDFFNDRGIELNTATHQNHLWVARTGSVPSIRSCMDSLNYLSSPFAMGRKRMRYQEFLSSHPAPS